MQINIQFNSYNPRRYSKPWIAKVTNWEIGKKADLEWGRWLGTPGSGGLTEIEANEGDIVRWGQKDNRQGTGTRAYWGVVQKDASIDRSTESQCAKAFRQVTLNFLKEVAE